MNENPNGLNPAIQAVGGMFGLGNGISYVPGTLTFTSNTRWKFCPDCGTALGLDWKFCAGCAKAIPMAGMWQSPYIGVVTYPGVSPWGGTFIGYNDLAGSSGAQSIGGPTSNQWPTVTSTEL